MTSTSRPLQFDGFEVPWIKASPNRSVWDETFDAPGVLYAAYPFDADVDTVYERVELTDWSAPTWRWWTYDDGAFFGQWWQHSQCGPDARRNGTPSSPARRARTSRRW